MCICTFQPSIIHKRWLSTFWTLLNHYSFPVKTIVPLVDTGYFPLQPLPLMVGHWELPSTTICILPVGHWKLLNHHCFVLGLCVCMCKVSRSVCVCLRTTKTPRWNVLKASTASSASKITWLRATRGALCVCMHAGVLMCVYVCPSSYGWVFTHPHVCRGLVCGQKSHLNMSDLFPARSSLAERLLLSQSAGGYHLAEGDFGDDPAIHTHVPHPPLTARGCARAHA